MMCEIKKVFWIIVFFLFLNSYCQSQTDSSKYIFGWQVATGVMHQNFSALNKYEYLLNRPQNFSFQYPSPSLFIGNPEKFFISISLSTAFGSENSGTYNNYNIKTGGSHSFVGGNFNFPLKTYFSKKSLQGIYVSLGVRYVSTSVYSKAQGINSLMRDTTFYYENSKAKNAVANAEIIFEFFSLGKKHARMRYPLMVKFGYNLQIQKPTWSGDYSRYNGDENPNINLGGFYWGIGFNFWLKKGVMKSWFKK
ncbi:MAG TPA: hypothetical protein VNG53_06375 [Bacteroidia bacterium]|nr:hypothetical protein [Bacteroidia bacterium]